MRYALERKGLANMSIFSLALTAAVAFIVIALITQGNLGEAIQTGFEMSKKDSDKTIDIEGDQEKMQRMLSQAAMFAYHRASNDGCKEGGKKPTVPDQNKGSNPTTAGSKPGPDKGYPALADTYLGTEPPCVGGGSTLISGGLSGYVQQEGYDMEGIYSRVAFEITGDRPVILQTRGTPDTNPEKNTWLEYNLIGAGKGQFEEHINKDSCGLLFSNYLGTHDNYMMFFPDDASDRTVWINDEYNLDRGLYCVNAWSGISGSAPKYAPYASTAVPGIMFNKDTIVKLCPGDKGYIQVNKGGPLNEGEAGENIIGQDTTYPYIQITETDPDVSCAGINSDPPQIKGTSVSRSTSSYLEFSVDVENRRAEDKDYTIGVIPEGGSSVEEDQSWQQIGKGSEETINFDLYLPDFGPGTKWGCEPSLVVKERNEGYWTDGAVAINVSDYVGNCGGGPPVEGTIENVQFNKQGQMLGPDLLGVDVTVGNQGDFDGQFRTFYHDQGSEQARLPKHPFLAGLRWKDIANGDQGTISGDVGKLSNYDCDVRIVLRETENQGNFVVDEGTFNIPGSVKPGC